METSSPTLRIWLLVRLWRLACRYASNSASTTRVAAVPSASVALDPLLTLLGLSMMAAGVRVTAGGPRQTNITYQALQTSTDRGWKALSHPGRSNGVGSHAPSLVLTSSPTRMMSTEGWCLR